MNAESGMRSEECRGGDALVAGLVEGAPRILFASFAQRGNGRRGVAVTTLRRGVAATGMVIAFVLAGFSVRAVEVVPSLQPQQVFAGGARMVEVRFRNPAAEAARVEVRLHLFQLTSATAAPVSAPRAWRTLTVAPGQTVIENASVEVPAVRTATRFAARWLDAGGRLLGVTELWAQPVNLLDALGPLAGERPIGLTEETATLRPALVARGLAVAELKRAEDWTEFRGRLVLVVAGPESIQGELRLAPPQLARVKEGLAVVWLQTPPAISPPGPPWTERLRVDRGTVLVAPAAAVAGLEHSAAAQAALVRLAELALSPPTQLLASTP